MRLKEFIDPNKVLGDIVKGMDVDAQTKQNLLKGTAWDTGSTKPQRSRGISGKSATRPQAARSSANTSKITRNIVSPSSIRDYILSKGLSRNHAAGMIANIKAESGFNSAAYNPNDLGARSIGFFQHRAGRANALEKTVPNWRTDWQGQIDFALSENAGQQYARTKFRTPQEATTWFTVHFEKPRHPERQAAIRAASASQYA